MIEFKPWPKTPRLFRDMIVTEKIDGTNSAVGIVAVDEEDFTPNVIAHVENDGRLYAVYAQSRKRLITPGKQTDNHGFAEWVERNAETLVEDLGAGLHFGEWWGYKIARGYGLGEGDRRFSLFNTGRYGEITFTTPDVETVPVLHEGRFNSGTVEFVVDTLRAYGSVAAPGFASPEGVVVFHSASNSVYKVLLENDELPKGVLPLPHTGTVPA